ncbi:MAG: ABC transporter ATP-binding protein [Bacilli bacterium]
MSYIEIKNYTKKIKDKTILDNINYSFEKGKIYGLYGRNGSGKTMLLRAISGLIIPTDGSVTVNNEIIHKTVDFPNDTGIIIENLSLFPEYSAFQNLKRLSKIQNKATDEDIYNAIELVGLDPKNHEKIKTYSLGMKQKLNIAQAIFEDQELLLLDEPTNALDRQSVQDIYNLFMQLKEKGKTLIIASHIRDDLESYCDSVLFIENGKLYNEENIE